MPKSISKGHSGRKEFFGPRPSRFPAVEMAVEPAASGPVQNLAHCLPLARAPLKLPRVAPVVPQRLNSKPDSLSYHPMVLTVPNPHGKTSFSVVFEPFCVRALICSALGSIWVSLPLAGL
jgi:hypothetical protein